MQRFKSRGFTLIELITVIAVSTVLMTIIIVPVIQGFNMTRAAEGFAQAQSQGRLLIQQLEGEMSNAVSIRPTSGISGQVGIRVPDDTNTLTTVILPHAKIDLYPPAEGDASLQSGGAFINPDTNKVDPTSRAPIGDANLPAVRGMSMTRYWIGLRDPSQPYNNPYINYRTSGGARWAVGTGGQDNLFVLYKAEVQPKVMVGGVLSVNATYFDDADGDGQPDLDDPLFFLPGADPGDANHDLRAAAWKRAARIVTQISRFDMIQPEINRQNFRLLTDGTALRITPLIRFQPARVSAETSSAQVVVGAGLETDNADKVGPESYTTQYGSWDPQAFTLWQSFYPASFGAVGNSSGRVRSSWSNGQPFQIATYGTTGWLLSGNNGDPLFNISNYMHLKELQEAPGSLYPFTQSVNAAAVSPPWRNNFVPFWFDSRAGKVMTSFDIREVGSDTSVDFRYRVPSTAAMNAGGDQGIHVGPPTAFAAEANPAAIAWQDATTDLNVGINRRFNSLWANWDALAPMLDRAQFCKRFIDLRATVQPGTVPSPLDRRPTPDGSGFVRAQIVPGSEEVIGPDQRPGPNYGKFVRYSRVTQRPVGANQYYINYVDQPEPDWNTVGFAGANYNPAFYDPNNFLSAVLQAQYRAGYIELNSQLGEPIPGLVNDPGNPGDDTPGNFLISYRFQFTEPNDVVAVDYDSTEMMEVVLTVRNYAQTTFPHPQNVTIKGAAQVRNFMR